jgi:hypothetical protein
MRNGQSSPEDTMLLIYSKGKTEAPGQNNKILSAPFEHLPLYNTQVKTKELKRKLRAPPTEYSKSNKNLYTSPGQTKTDLSKS